MVASCHGWDMWDSQGKSASLLLLCSDLGAHIDGFIATAAHTVVLQESEEEAPLTGRVADLLTAAHTALEAAIRLFRPGKRISEVGGAAADAALSHAWLLPLAVNPLPFMPPFARHRRRRCSATASPLPASIHGVPPSV